MQPFDMAPSVTQALISEPCEPFVGLEGAQQGTTFTLPRGHHPNFGKKTLREFGLTFWRPTTSESRSESCSENRRFTQLRL